MILLNPGPMWIVVTSPQRALLPPGVGYIAPDGIETVNWIEYPHKPNQEEVA